MPIITRQNWNSSEYVIICITSSHEGWRANRLPSSTAPMRILPHPRRSFNRQPYSIFKGYSVCSVQPYTPGSHTFASRSLIQRLPL